MDFKNDFKTSTQHKKVNQSIENDEMDLLEWFITFRIQILNDLKEKKGRIYKQVVNLAELMPCWN